MTPPPADPEVATPPGLEHVLIAHIEREEHKFSEGDKRMEKIEKDLQPITKIYNAMLGLALAGGLIAILAGSIYFEDRSTTKSLVEGMMRQGHAIEKMLIKHEELEKDTNKNFQRLERDLDRRLAR